MRVNGRKIRPMVTVSTFTSMELSMKDTGRTISKMVKVWRAGKTVADMKEDIRKE